ncbi:MAG: pyridoxal phosphate-dependent aminotransferase [Chitinophagaceae bacterium]
MELSSRLERFNEPETLKMAKLGRELRAQGFDIIDLSLGEPDFDTPQHIKDAAIKAIEDNWTHYPPVAGYPELRQAICDKFLRDNQLHYQPENIVVSTGAKQSLANAILAIVDKDDEVIIPTPYWVTYSELVKLAEAKPVLVRTTAEQNFKISPEQLAANINERTKLFMFSSPCNPTGAVYSKAELAALVAVLEQHPQIFVISDEIYEYINFVGKHESIASFESIKERVVIVNGLSKGFAMTGWRLGYIAAHTTIAKACEKLQGQFTSGANSVTQRAAIVAMNGSLQPTTEMVAEFARRRTHVLSLIASIPGITCFAPEGAFYTFPDVSSYFGKRYADTTIETAEDLCMFLLHTAHVSTVTGKAFGEPNCIRLSFANSMEKIEEGYRRIKTALALLQ